MLLSSYILTFPFWALTWKASFTNAAAAPITQAFEISFEKNQGGNCAYVGEDLLNNIFKDCLTLAEIGMNMTQVYGTDIKAKRVIDAFFGDSTDLLSDQQTEVIHAFGEVKRWIEDPDFRAVNNGNGKAKPWLFCDHTWLLRKDMNSQALDKNGEGMTDVESQPVKMIDIPEYKQQQQEETDALGLRKGSSAIPYYSPINKSYLFDKSYGGASSGFCSPKYHSGATSHRLLTTTLTLCPASFGTDRSIKKAKYRGLHSGTITPLKRSDVESGKIPVNASKLGQDVTPTAATLFHELFHVVLGNDATYPDQGEIYDLDKLLEIDFFEAMKNPESFTLAAVAWDYTENGQGGVEFYPGYAVVD